MPKFKPFDEETESTFDRAVAEYAPADRYRQPQQALNTMKKVAFMAQIANVAVTIGPGELLDLIAEIEASRAAKGD